MWSLAHILCLILGAGLVGGGLYLLHGHRVPEADKTEAEPGPGPLWLTHQMRLVLGACLMIGGYHVAAYGSPEAWFPLKVSRELWWLVPLVIGLAVGSTFVLDRLLRTNQGR